MNAALAAARFSFAFERRRRDSMWPSASALGKKIPRAARNSRAPFAYLASSVQPGRPLRHASAPSSASFSLWETFFLLTSVYKYANMACFYLWRNA